MQKISILLLSLCVASCATETSRVIEAPKVTAAASNYNGPRIAVSVGKFDNRSAYMNGIFADSNDRLGSQAKTILKTHLQQSRHFNVLDRENLAESKQEAAYAGTAQTIKGANLIITGDVTEFGRKEVGDQQLFGILGHGKSQIAYAKVAINVVDPKTSSVVYSVQGSGEFALSNREVIGFGGTASYDSTLNGKVLDLAIREAVNKLVDGMDNGTFTPAN